MAPDTEAIDALVELGLTEYEARCFVALTQLSQGTAKEMSRVADVPQSRVYDVTDRLYDRGLIDIEDGDPKRYIALPVQEAVERLHREFSDHIETASDALERLDTRERDEDGVWTIATQADLLTRVTMHVEDATDEVYLHSAHESLLESDLLGELAAASERGVTLYVEVPSEALRDRVHEYAPGATVGLSELPFDAATTGDRTPGRLLMVDRETILMSARTDGLVPGDDAETGLWGSEVGHGLVVWLRPLVAWRIDQLEPSTAE